MARGGRVVMTPYGGGGQGPACWHRGADLRPFVALLYALIAPRLPAVKGTDVDQPAIWRRASR
jgi:hypothetical protein